MAPARRSRRAAPKEPSPAPSSSPQLSEPELEPEAPDAGADSDGELSPAPDQASSPISDPPSDVDEPAPGNGTASNGGRSAADGPRQTLKFDELLTWKPAKPIAVGTLIPRLRRLLDELSDMDQDLADPDSLADVAAALAHRNLLQHRDSGVRAFVAACLADVLRICAPNAPFASEQVNSIFSLFIREIIPALKDTGSTYYAQHKYVLVSLSEVKSILLVMEIEGGDELFLRLTSACFDTISMLASHDPEGNVPRDIEHHMTHMLVTLIDESPGIPAMVIDSIMAQFLRTLPPGGPKNRLERSDDASQSNLLPKKLPAAYVMAKNICIECPEKMARYVSQYFSDVIIDATSLNRGQNDDDDDTSAPSGPSEADLNNIRQAHLLIRELWRAEPTVLQNVIPQVEAQLSADNVSLRQLATETFGDMISGIGAAGPPPSPVMDPCQYPQWRLSDEVAPHPSQSVLNTPMAVLSFSQAHPAAYQSFLGRRIDKSGSIRAAWALSIGYILSTSAGGIGLSREDQNQLVQALCEKMLESDDKVRLAAIKAVDLFSLNDVITKLGMYGGVEKQGSILAILADRCRDRKPAVRVEAMVLLGKLWSVAAGEIAAGQEAVVSCLGGIPSSIIDVYYTGDTESITILDRVLLEYIVPLGFPPRKPKKNGAQAAAAPTYDADKVRAERILQLVRSLNDKAKRAFFAMQARQPNMMAPVNAYIRQCELFNGGVVEANEDKVTNNLNGVIKWLAGRLPDQQKAQADLERFAKVNERRYYALVRYAIDYNNDFKTVHDAIKELVKRVNGDSKCTGAMETLLPLIYQAACIMFNKSHLAAFMDYSKNNRDGLGSAAHEILGEISQRNPAIFKSHIGELCKNLVDQAPSRSKENDPSVVDILKACASYAKKDTEDMPRDTKFLETMKNYALYGRPPKAAKYALNIIVASSDVESQETARSILRRIMKEWKFGAPNFLNHLACIAQLALKTPKLTEEYDQEMLDIAIQKLLLQVHGEEGKDSSDRSWVDDGDLDEEIQAKLLALKILVNNLQATATTAGDDESKNRIGAVFKLLRTLLTKDGELCKTKDTPKHHRNRLMLAAAHMMLKLCRESRFDPFLTPTDFNNLAFMAQHGEPAVRHRFVEKLQKYLAANELPVRFYTIVFLTAFEPIASFKERLGTWIDARARFFIERNKPVLEPVVCRLISLLAHHPDYSNEPENLVDHARYLLYYIGHVVTEANLGLIFRYVERAKQTVDAIDADLSQNIYVLCDLALALLRRWQERKGWSFQAYSHKVGLPIGLFSALPSHKAAVEIAGRQYLPEGVEEDLDRLMRSLDGKKKRKTADDRRGDHPAKRARSMKLPSREKHAKSKSKASSTRPSHGSGAKKARRARARDAWGSDADDDNDDAAAEARANIERRKSGRSRSGQTSATYAERDSSEDDEEMLDGVAEWTYLDETGRPKPVDSDDALSEAGDEEEEEKEEKEEQAPKKKNKKNSSSNSAPANGTGNGNGNDTDSSLSDISDMDDALSDDQEEEEEAAAPSRARSSRRR